MGRVNNEVEKVNIELSLDELTDLIEVLERSGNSTARYSNAFPEGSIRRRTEQDRAYAAWNWAETLSIGTEPGIGCDFEVKGL